MRLPFSRPPLFRSVVLLLALWPAIPVVVQTNTAEIAGVVRDAQSGVLPGATVIASHVGSGFTVVRVTDQAGRYFLPALPIGEYTLVVELLGFSQFAQRGLS
jgi:hypothetical protein